MRDIREPASGQLVGDVFVIAGGNLAIDVHRIVRTMPGQLPADAPFRLRVLDAIRQMEVWKLAENHCQFFRRQHFEHRHQFDEVHGSRKKFVVQRRHHRAVLSASTIFP